jgi:hypothetical protein
LTYVCEEDDEEESDVWLLLDVLLELELLLDCLELLLLLEELLLELDSVTFLKENS